MNHFSQNAKHVPFSDRGGPKSMLSFVKCATTNFSFPSGVKLFLFHFLTMKKF